LKVGYGEKCLKFAELKTSQMKKFGILVKKKINLKHNTAEET